VEWFDAEPLGGLGQAALVADGLHQPEIVPGEGDGHAIELLTLRTCKRELAT
jgi:hypothetical protein